jgi:hypothetical protein
MLAEAAHHAPVAHLEWLDRADLYAEELQLAHSNGLGRGQKPPIACCQLLT